MTCDAFSTSIRTSSTLPSGTYSTRSSLRASSLPSAELPGPSVFANVLATNNSPKAGVSSLIATVMSTSAGDIRVNGVAPAASCRQTGRPVRARRSCPMTRPCTSPRTCLLPTSRWDGSGSEARSRRLPSSWPRTSRASSPVSRSPFDSGVTSRIGGAPEQGPMETLSRPAVVAEAGDQPAAGGAIASSPSVRSSAQARKMFRRASSQVPATRRNASS